MSYFQTLCCKSRKITITCIQLQKSEFVVLHTVKSVKSAILLLRRSSFFASCEKCWIKFTVNAKKSSKRVIFCEFSNIMKFKKKPSDGVLISIFWMQKKRLEAWIKSKVKKFGRWRLTFYTVNREKVVLVWYFWGKLDRTNLNVKTLFKL